jgi:hypothetical protein
MSKRSQESKKLLLKMNRLRRLNMNQIMVTMRRKLRLTQANTVEQMMAPEGYPGDPELWADAQRGDSSPGCVRRNRHQLPN